MQHYDLAVIGGGINGCGIARDASGRGLSVLVAEAGDLAGATSSASTKLIHGGLRYLEQFEFRLVAEALAAVRPQLVLVATPPSFHADLCIAALEAGAWALCEKPFCASLAELDQKIRSPRAYNRPRR